MALFFIIKKIEYIGQSYVLSYYIMKNSTMLPPPPSDLGDITIIP